MSQIEQTISEQNTVTAGILDFPRKKLPEDVWEYREESVLPVLNPELRAEILKEARKKLAYFGADLIGANLYGGAAGYQYHKGGDIDVSLYINRETFKGSDETLSQVFKQVEIPWGDYVVHMFVKPKDQPEQIEVADAYYDVLRDRWKLPPLVLPKDFDPNIFFQQLIEIADEKAQNIDVLMGKVSREWAKLKVAAEARRDGGRDPEIIDERIEIQKMVLLDLIGVLVRDFVEIWDARKKMHDILRKEYVRNPNVNRYKRFQVSEIVWKYLDQAGYAEYLKMLTKAYSQKVIEKLLESV